VEKFTVEEKVLRVVDSKVEGGKKRVVRKRMVKKRKRSPNDDEQPKTAAKKANNNNNTNSKSTEAPKPVSENTPPLPPNGSNAPTADDDEFEYEFEEYEEEVDDEELERILREAEEATKVAAPEQEFQKMLMQMLAENDEMVEVGDLCDAVELSKEEVEESLKRLVEGNTIMVSDDVVYKV